MKKVLVIFLILMSISFCCSAQALSSINSKEVNINTEYTNIKYQKKIMNIGFKILNDNRIDKRMVFHYNNRRKVNAAAYSIDKSVVVYTGLLAYLENDAELAAILSHEIAHNIDYYAGFWRQIAMAFASKKYEKKADLKGIDYMVKSGYNPVSMIIALNKFSGESNAASHPMTSKRLAYMYEYIYLKYPAYLVDNEYKRNIYYQNFLLTSKKDRVKIRENFQKRKAKKG